MHLRPHRRHSRPMHLRLPPHPAHHPEAEAEAAKGQGDSLAFAELTSLREDVGARCDFLN